ncbi:MAG: ABC transporter permease subunit [Anaerolineales bacterium]|nr:ABC transporter permease subunit [Anaerolineales bacterium]
MKHIRTLIAKEWAEVFQNRIVVFTVGALPLLLALLPLGILLTMRGTTLGGGETSDLPPSMIKACGAIAIGDCFQIFLLNQFLPLFMMMPLFIPIAIASYSIVGEKTTRSLEPLLATPITTEELLAGKALAAVIPAVLATWGSFVIFLIGLPLVGASSPALLTALSPTWFAATLLIGPLVSVLAVIFALMVSSRVNDPRVAEQISGVLIVPVLGLVFGQLAGVLVLNLQLMLTVAAGLAVIDVILVFFGARLFQREVILTRWK